MFDHHLKWHVGYRAEIDLRLTQVVTVNTQSPHGGAIIDVKSEKKNYYKR